MLKNTNHFEMGEVKSKLYSLKHDFKMDQACGWLMMNISGHNSLGALYNMSACCS